MDFTYCSPLPVNKEFEMVAAMFEKSIGRGCCLQNIYKIEHEKLNARFNAAREEITRKCEGKVPEEILVFHGTTAQGARGIVETGFDKKYNRVAAYGLGTYASSNASTALTYCKDAYINDGVCYIFICRILKGRYGRGVQQQPIDTTIMDYSGSGGADNIIVTPYDDAIIPVYLIEYYRAAK